MTAGKIEFLMATALIARRYSECQRSRGAHSFNGTAFRRSNWH